MTLGRGQVHTRRGRNLSSRHGNASRIRRRRRLRGIDRGPSILSRTGGGGA